MTSATICDDILQGDCLEVMGGLRGSVDLVFADPPFNIGYEYDTYKDSMSAGEYIRWTERWIGLAYEAIRENGSLWVAIGDDFAAEVKVAATELGFHLRSWVIWYYTFGVNCKNKFTRSHTHLLYFVKDRERFTFNADDPAVRVPSARQLVYGDKRANPRGRLPDDTWILRPQDCDGFTAGEDTWHFPRVAGTFKERAGFHGCQMPEALMERIVRCCSNPGDLVLDPFAGSGTTLVAAKRLGRRWLGIELSEHYAAQAKARVDLVQDLMGE